MTESYPSKQAEQTVKTIIGHGKRSMLNGQDKRNDYYDEMNMCCYLLAISQPRAIHDIYWQLDDYRNPVMINAKTQQPYKLMDITLEIMTI